MKPVFQFYAGFKISFNQLNIDWSKLEFSDQFEPTQLGVVRSSAFAPNSSGQKLFFDMDFGIAGRFLLSPNWTNEVSFSVAHLVRPDISLTGVETILPLKYTGHLITSFPLSKKNKLHLSPKVLIESQADFMSFTPGITLYYVKKVNMKIETKPFYIGVYYRTGGFNDGGNANSIILNVGHNGYWEPKNMKYQIGFSYDATMVNLPINYTYGAFEITATIVFNTKSLDKLNKRCPEFLGSPLGPIE